MLVRCVCDYGVMLEFKTSEDADSLLKKMQDDSAKDIVFEDKAPSGEKMYQGVLRSRIISYSIVPEMHIATRPDLH